MIVHACIVLYSSISRTRFHHSHMDIGYDGLLYFRFFDIPILNSPLKEMSTCGIIYRFTRNCLHSLVGHVEVESICESGC